VLGLTPGPRGFPAERESDPVLDLVLPVEAGFPHAEERRLFYVALTRARQRVYLLTDGRRSSSFVRELRDAAYQGQVEFRGDLSVDLACRLCGVGTMAVRQGSRGAFWGCSRFPECTETRPHCGVCHKAPLLPPSERAAERVCADPTCSSLAQEHTFEARRRQ
jgi:DNA helicase IV